MKHPYKRAIITLLTITLANSQCHICGEEGNLALKHPHGYIAGETLNCVALTMKTFFEAQSYRECSLKQKKYQACCDGTHLPPRPPAPFKPPKYKHVGPHPACNICRDGGYPKDPGHVINMLYLGASTCKDYYRGGQEGKIPRHLCDPLKFFARQPCNCPAVKKKHPPANDMKRAGMK